MITLTPTREAASRMRSVIRLGSSITILPNPTYNGVSPEFRKRAKSSGGVYEGSERRKNPQISGENGQHMGLLLNYKKQYQCCFPSPGALEPRMATSSKCMESSESQ